MKKMFTQLGLFGKAAFMWLLVLVTISTTLKGQDYVTIANGVWNSTNTSIWAGGLIPPNPIPAGETVQIDHRITLGEPWENNGDINVRFALDFAAPFTNNVGAAVSGIDGLPATCQVSWSSTFENYGTINLFAGSGLHNIKFGGTLNNYASGLIDYIADGGYLAVGTFADEVLNNFGTINIAPASVGGSTTYFPLLTTRPNSSNPTINSATGIINNNGALGGTTGSVILPTPANYTGNGRIHGGFIGLRFFFSSEISRWGANFKSIFELNGTFEPTSILTTIIDGRTIGSEYTSLSLTGAADISSATVEVGLETGFNPILGDEFLVLEATEGITGTFASTIFPDLSDPLEFRTRYEPNRAWVVVADKNTPTCSTPTISTQPVATSTEVCIGEAASFTVAVTPQDGVTFSYEWQEETSPDNWSTVGSNSAILNIDSTTDTDVGKKYRVIISSDNGTSDNTDDDCSTTSEEVMLTLIDCLPPAELPVLGNWGRLFLMLLVTGVSIWFLMFSRTRHS
ncbi:MAG: hypothetical protein Sapg2KO_13350 [Saprospiraceae bacterium]